FIMAFAIPLNFMITSQVPMLAWLAVVIGICVGHNSVYAPTAALYSEMFPAHVRYSGASIGYQLGGAIAGFVPLTAASMVGAAGGAYWPIPALIAGSGLIGFICILLVRPAAEPLGASTDAVAPGEQRDVRYLGARLNV